MSEKLPPEKKVSETIMEELKSLREELKTLTTKEPPKEPPKTESKGHETLEDLENCPTCRAKYKIDEFKKREHDKALQELKEKAKGDFNCVNCGLKVSKDAKECPLCGETKAE